MNNTLETTEEQADSKMIALLKSAGTAVHPSEASFRAMLSKLPTQVVVPSPYAPKKSPYTKYWLKAAVTMLVVVVLVGGSTLFYRKSGTITPSTSGVSSVAMVTPENGTVGADQTASPNQVAMMVPSSMANPEAAALAPGDSDASLAQDEQSIDNQMAALDTDNTSADQSLAANQT